MSYRWTLRNLKTDEVTELLINPNQMESGYRRWETEFQDRSLLSHANRARRKPFTPFEMGFSGVVLDKAGYDQMRALARTTVKYEWTDHLGRTATVRFVSWAPTQKAPKRPRHPWRHTYDARWLVYTPMSRITP